MNLELNKKQEKNLDNSNNLQETTNIENVRELKFSKKNVINIIKNFLLIFVVSFFSFVLFLTGMFFINPKIDAKIFNFFGMKSLEESCYIQIYKKSENNADLYNLIIFEKQAGNYEKELEYLKLLKGKSNYKEFCEKMDLTGLDFCGNNKDKFIYYADVNAYFESRIIICKFNLNLNNGANFDILTELKDNLNADNLTEYSFFEYINLILTTNSLLKEKKLELVEIISKNSLIELVINRINKIENTMVNNDNEVQKILLQNSLINHIKAVYYFEVVFNNGETNTAIAFKDLYEIEYKKYLTMIV